MCTITQIKLVASFRKSEMVLRCREQTGRQKLVLSRLDINRINRGFSTRKKCRIIEIPTFS